MCMGLKHIYIRNAKEKRYIYYNTIPYRMTKNNTYFCFNQNLHFYISL